MANGAERGARATGWMRSGRRSSSGSPSSASPGDGAPRRPRAVLAGARRGATPRVAAPLYRHRARRPSRPRSPSRCSGAAGGGSRGLAYAQITFDVAHRHRLVVPHRRRRQRLRLLVPAGGGERRAAALPARGDPGGALSSCSRVLRWGSTCAGCCRPAVRQASPGGAHLHLFAHVGAIPSSGGAGQLPGRAAPHHGEQLNARERDFAAVDRAARGHRAVDRERHRSPLDAAGRITFLNRAGEQISGLAAGGRSRASPPRAGSPACRASRRRDETDFEQRRAGERLLPGAHASPLHGRDGGATGTWSSSRTSPSCAPWRRRCSATSGWPPWAASRRAWPTSCATRWRRMSGSIELLARGRGLGPTRQRLMRHRAARGGRGSTGWSPDFLRFARPAAPPARAADLARLVAETLDVFAQRARGGEGWGSSASSRPAPVAVRRRQLRQVLWNLLRNAAQAIAATAAGHPRGSAAPRADGGAPARGGGRRAGHRPRGPGRASSTRSSPPRRGAPGSGWPWCTRIVEAHQAARSRSESASRAGRALPVRSGLPAPGEPASLRG